MAQPERVAPEREEAGSKDSGARRVGTGHNVRGIHTLAASRAAIDAQLAWAGRLIGAGGAVTQPFLGLGPNSPGPTPDAVYFVEQAYVRDLDPILVLQGRFVNRDGCNPSDYTGWLAPMPDRPDGPYSTEAEGYRRFVAGLPRVDGRTLYVQVGNEPNLHEMWGGAANPAAYARFFADVSDALRSLGDRRIVILNAALAPEGDVDNLAFIAQAIQAEPRFAGAFDLWASHPYPRNQPPANNLHDGTALPNSRYAIDAYLLELAALAEHGVDTTGLQVILTETGYELGDSFYPEYPPISEERRAEYVQQAFSDYWLRWPDVRTVTPFELSGWYGSWEAFDWVWPTSTTTVHGFPTQPRLQYARLVPDTGLVVGTVHDDHGFPVKDAIVSSQPGGFQAITLPDGSFVMVAAPGLYTVTTERRGYDTTTMLDVPVRLDSPTRLTVTLPARPAPILRNADFEASDLDDWTPWGSTDGVQEGPWFFEVQPHDGARFLGTAVNCGAKDGGVFQSVAARPESTVTVRAWTLTYADGAASNRNRVGVDPAGGGDPTAERIVWSDWIATDGHWQEIGVSVQPAGSRVTIFLQHDQDAANPWNVSAFDGVSVHSEP
ncbi:MAG: carboxypeptidase regulatory-like domain-containing protein [Chloroflexi bacterium]|nr:carboxypeptidase regulatory-like domain-containing protein [Chloroflexota bacterium]